MTEQGLPQRAGAAAACVACCAVPMLVIAGVVSLGTAVVAGTTAAAVVAVAGGMWAFWRHRLPVTPLAARLGLAGAGILVAAFGLSRGEPLDGTARSAVAMGVAGLAGAALLALTAARVAER